MITAPTIDRAIPANVLARTAKKFVAKVDEQPTVDRAVARALQIVRQDQVICIAGSLYVVGEAMQTLQQMGLMKIVSVGPEKPLSAGTLKWLVDINNELP